MRQIEIWFTELDGRFFVIAEYATAHWLQNLQANPAVQVKVAGKTVNAKAQIVSAETDLHRTVQELSRKKYNWGEGTIVELTPTENQEQRTGN